MKKVVILGGGLSGLSAGMKLAEAGYCVDVLEKKERVGGISSSFRRDGFILDYGPHKIYTQIDGLMEVIKDLLGDDLLVLEKKSKMFLKGRYVDYPVKITDVLIKLGPVTVLNFGFSYLATMLRNLVSKPKDDTYESYLVNRFGRATYDLVLGQYAEKVWGDSKNLHADLAKTRVAAPSLIEMAKRAALGDRGRPEISAKHFYYPKNGIIELSEKMVERIEKNGGKVRLNAYPTGLVLSGKSVGKVNFIENGTRKALEPDFVISTIPINEVPGLMSPPAPPELMSVAKSLTYRSIVLLYVVANKERVFEENWIFFPGKKSVFNRLSEQKGFSPYTVPKGKTVLCAEITCSATDAIWKMPDKEIFERVIHDLEKINLLKREEVQEYFSERIPDAYPLYNLEFRKNLDAVLKHIDENVENMLTIGRQGLFNYNNTDHCMDMGFAAAGFITSGKPRSEWYETRKRFEGYKIID